MLFAAISVVLSGCGGGSGGDSNDHVDDGMVATPPKPFPEGTCAAYVIEPNGYDESYTATVSRGAYKAERVSPEYIGEWKQLNEFFCSELEANGNDYATLRWHWDNFRQETVRSAKFEKYLSIDKANEILLHIGSSIHIDKDKFDFVRVENHSNVTGAEHERQYKTVYWYPYGKGGMFTIELDRRYYHGIDGVLVREYNGSGQGYDLIRYEYEPMKAHFDKYYVDNSETELWFDQIVYNLDYTYNK